ncbi:arsenic resistance protein [Wohlfahrtiimonas larvae]|uniref:Arsenic resistance protein n=1 Tax=Wohlfahrtiimonas larvae TaxID=1157986 RepID=A0ABP9ME36_9GAMM|nr:arsenic resistance protein [Wohlfahrtiimonas larvae]
MRDQIEHNQVNIYAVTIIIAIVIGFIFPAVHTLNNVLPVTLGILMYSMFLQIPFADLKASFSNRQFMIALLISNYIIVPLLAYLLIQFLPNQPAIIFAVLLVLLTPCIDYVIVFTQIGKGDAKLMLASTPLLFITQILLLPVYIWLMLGKGFLGSLSIMPFIESFLFLIVIPLIAAILVQTFSAKNRIINITHEISNWLPVPFMAIVLFIIIASQITPIALHYEQIIQVIPIYIAFIALMFPLNLLVGKLFKLKSESKRTLIFSAGTRNSLAVLPFALALPEDMILITTSIIVTQTIVELIGELVYVKLTPKIQ